MSINDDHSLSFSVTRRSLVAGLVAAPAIAVLSGSGKLSAQPTKGSATRTFDVTKYTHMLVPRGHGEILPIREGYRGRYPSRNHSMQLIVFMDDQEALYIQTKDPDAHITDWTVTKSGRLTVTFWGPEVEIVAQRIKPRLEQIADVYRTWALRQFWARKKNSVTDEVSYIAMASSNRMADMRRLTPTFIEQFSAPTACWITQWRRYPFDKMYPDYKAGNDHDMKGFLTDLRDLDSIPLPYVNGCLVDEELINESNRKFMIQDQVGNTPFYNAEKQYLRYACPGTEYWQNEILVARSSILDKDDRISEGVYYDMIAATDPKLCYAKGHNHAPGDSLIWQRSFREILRKTPGVIMTEGNAEVYLDLVDVLLMHFQTEKESTVPLWTHVYGDLCNVGGWNLAPGLGSSGFRKEISKIKSYGASYLGSPWMKSARQNEYLANIEKPVPPELHAS